MIAPVTSELNTLLVGPIDVPSSAAPSRKRIVLISNGCKSRRDDVIVDLQVGAGVFQQVGLACREDLGSQLDRHARAGRPAAS